MSGIHESWSQGAMVSTYRYTGDTVPAAWSRRLNHSVIKQTVHEGFNPTSMAASVLSKSGSIHRWRIHSLGMKFYSNCSNGPPPTSIHFRALRMRFAIVRRSISSVTVSIAAWIRSQRSSSSRGRSRPYTHAFTRPKRKKSSGFNSGDRAGQLMVPPRPIHLLGKCPFNQSLTTLVKWASAPSCWNHIFWRRSSGTSASNSGRSSRGKFRYVRPLSHIGSSWARVWNSSENNYFRYFCKWSFKLQT